MVDRLRNTDVNARRIANVEACFGSSGRPLFAPDRVLVGEGVLMKLCRKKAKPRQFFLFNDILVYGSILLSKRRYNRQHVIPLEEIKVENIVDLDEDSKYGFLLKSRTKSFMVYAESEKEQWMTHICRCVENLLKHGGHAVNDHAAVWVPDSEAAKCMCCRNTHFTVIQRRHHCRACGNVVCRSCSSKSFILEGISKRPVRVCDTCYNKLCQGMKTTSGGAVNNVVPVNESSESDDEDVQYVNHEAATFYQGEENPVRNEQLI
ncbi:hypothetical protein M3Y97_00711700 [Aphelenchoides bicaudatus]|nr:hypothetical protein M3Y97_00711700 [Aphelenchoides bicaudatus]